MSPKAALDDGFKEVLGAMADTLQEHGFKKSRHDFTRRGDGGWAVVNVQRSQHNDGDELRFTVNLAATADALRDGSADKAPKEAECDLQTRLDTGKSTSFWAIRDKTDTGRMAKQVQKALEKDAVPLLDQVGDAEGLRDFWLEHVDDDETPLSKLVTLLEAIGPESKADTVRKKFEKRKAQREKAAAKAG